MEDVEDLKFKQEIDEIMRRVDSVLSKIAELDPSGENDTRKDAD